MEVMRDPVMTVDGQTYERTEIEKWFALGNKTSPLTGEELPSTNLLPNIALRKAIRESAPLQLLAARTVRPHTIRGVPEMTGNNQPDGNPDQDKQAFFSRALVRDVGGVNLKKKLPCQCRLAMTGDARCALCVYQDIQDILFSPFKQGKATRPRILRA